MAASIADILLSQGQQAAESRQRQGSLNAALVGNLGGLTAESLQQYGAQRQAKLRSQKVYDLITNPDTTPEQILGTLGPDEGMKVLKAFSDMSALNTGQRKAAQDELPHLGQLYASLDEEHKAAIYPTLRQAVVKSGVPDSALPKDYQAGALEPLLKAVPKDAEPYTLAPGSSRFGADNQRVASVPAEPKAKPQPTIASLAADAADLTSPTHLQSAEALKSARAPAQPQYVTVKDPTTGKPVRKAFTAEEMGQGVPEYVKPNAAASDVTVLTPAGLDIAARNYAKTGTMPALGMGDKTTRQRIINRAAEIDAGTDIAANKADYRADSDALTKLKQQRAAVGAFESTALKNIDLFLSQAGKVVDTGSPMANTLVRNVSGKVLGSPDPLAYDAARQVAVNEIAKITSNPTLSGALSDSARHEVENFVPQSATLKQAVAVMRVLKQDIENRTTSLDQAIGDVQGRIKGQKPPIQVGAFKVTVQ